MRNLKRALSLALAAIMLIGMMVVSASAVSYNDLTDKDQIVNKDAVSMLVSLGIIEGKPDGSYAPTENVDRAQMAKMLSVIMNKGVDNSALYQSVNSGLTDITSNWAKGHINYCYTTGIIAGRGNGTFDPSATVTALEAAKMLLVAVGYDPKIEGFEGADWAINVSVRADEQGIFEGFTKDLSAPLNRDDAALLIYNALDVEMIQSYTTNNYPIAYSDHRTILADKYGVIKVQGVVVANEWASLASDDGDAALKEGKTTIYNGEGIFSTTGNTTVSKEDASLKTQTFNVSTPVDMLGKTVNLYIKKTTTLLQEKRTTTINNAVTRGIKTTAKMYESSVEWLGEVPENWRIVPAKALFAQSKETRHETDVQLTASQKYGIISQEDYMEKQSYKIVLADKGLENWKHVEPNDFIISLRSFQGGLEISYIPGCITWHYIVLKPKVGVEPEYFKWLFKSPRYIQALQRTANFIRDGQDLRFSNFVQVPLPLIPMDEQKEIAEYLNKETARIDSIIADITEQIEKLKEYRQSVISEVVTGKVAVE